MNILARFTLIIIGLTINLFVISCQNTTSSVDYTPPQLMSDKISTAPVKATPTLTRAATVAPIVNSKPDAVLTTATMTPEILTAVANLFPTETPQATATRVTSISVNGRNQPLVSGHPQSYLEQYRLVAFYGHPATPELGILGELPREQLVTDLQKTAVTYQQSGWTSYEVKPTIHFISSVANSDAGIDGMYRQQTELAVITEWIHFASLHDLAFIIDIQPGQAELMEEFARIRPLLYSPHVHLAIDPEFIMENNEIPGQTLGHIDANTINQIQAQLNDIALDIGLNKVLIVHQFEPDMIQNKMQIQDYPYVELLIDADGFGAPTTKLADYLQYAQEAGWEYGGLKLFRHWDQPILTPAEVQILFPLPALIIYQ